MLCSCHSENSFLFVATEYLRVHKGYFYSPIYVMNRHVLLFLYWRKKTSRFQLDYSSLIERNKKKTFGWTAEHIFQPMSKLQNKHSQSGNYAQASIISTETEQCRNWTRITVGSQPRVPKRI